MCEREKSRSHLGNTHISSQDSLSIFVKGYAKFDGRGWGRLNLNGGLDHSLKEMKVKRKEMKWFISKPCMQKAKFMTWKLL